MPSSRSSKRRSRSPSPRATSSRKSADYRSSEPDRGARSSRTQDPFAGVPESERFGKPPGPASVTADSDIPPPVQKEEPNFAPSGALAAEQNTFKGVVLRYSEPAEARKPTTRQRLYVFKGKEQIDMLHIHRQSAYLIGRERKVADIPVDHPSCSKQHAAIQYRQIVDVDPSSGKTGRVVKPYIIDLQSANGTFINGSLVPPSRYVELKVGDSIKFGFSSRDFVLMSEDISDDET
ncbi:hypothetical protein HKX48_009327 [Thoreauomyces humboldtii]|nr:hypothetical protein HKX48_009327 [Thoreauomyces humboldtii]